jgi:hypothetical protein
MTKIKYLFIFLFFVYNANSQTEQLISVDSIKKKFYQNYKIKKKYPQMNLLLILKFF